MAEGGEQAAGVPEEGAAPPDEEPWWMRYNIDEDFHTAEDVCSKIFRITLPPEDSEGDWERRTALKRMTDIVVDKVTRNFTINDANSKLEELCLSMGVNRAYCAFNYENTAAIHSAGWLHLETWRRLWQEHFASIIIGHYDIANLDDPIAWSVPPLMEGIDMLNAL
jgi:hypothetical protein